jgi:hypothetical protein
MDLDLMVTRTEIALRKDLSTDKVIKKNVFARQQILVLDSDDI